MNSQAELQRLVAMAEHSKLDIAELKRHAALTHGTFDGLANDISLFVARAYDTGTMTFEGADHVMNVLFGLICSQPPEELVIPEITHEVYDAFDQGEYYHDDDSRDVDPEQKYTRPMVRAALQKYREQ